MQNLLKKLKYTLQQFDGLWSVPFSFFLFWFVGVILTTIFGYGTGSYDMAFIQPLFLAGAVVIGATNFAVMGMYFTIRGLYRYLYGEKKSDGSIVNYSKRNWLSLTVWQRFLLTFFVLFYFSTAVIFVYSLLI